MEFQEKVKRLPSKVKKFFESDESMLELKKAFVAVNLESSLSRKIAREVGLIFVGDRKLKELPSIIQKKIEGNLANSIQKYTLAIEINKRLFYNFKDYFQDASRLIEVWSNEIDDNYSLNHASEEELLQKIVKKEPWIKLLLADHQKIKDNKTNLRNKTQSISVELLPIRKALDQYEELGEQTVTNNRIQIKPLSESARPSIKNWIYDYHYHLGTGRHTVMERGNYLFHSDNTKKLSDEERRKLALILKSLDEETPIKIDKKKHTVIFPSSSSEYKLDALASEDNKNLETSKKKIVDKKDEKADLFQIKKQESQSDFSLIKEKNSKKDNLPEDNLKKVEKKTTLNKPDHWLVGQDDHTMFRSAFNQDEANIQKQETGTGALKSGANKKIDNLSKKENPENKKKLAAQANPLRSRLYRIRPGGLDKNDKGDILKSVQNVINLKNKE